MDFIYDSSFSLKDTTVKCSCCGKDLKRGVMYMGSALGKDCYQAIQCINSRDLIQGTKLADMFSVKAKHFEWIARRKAQV